MLPILLSMVLACSSDSSEDTSQGVGPEAQEAVDSEPRFVPHAADGISVEQVDPARYLGLWYEIATTPSQQQSACAGTMAEYSLVDEETIGVTNRCYIGSLEGRLNEIDATARALDDSYARLMVDFGFGFEAPYTVIELYEPPGDEPYTYAAVTTSEVSYWILSRTPQMPQEMYDTLLEKIEERGGDSSRLIRTAQPELDGGVE